MEPLGCAVDAGFEGWMEQVRDTRYDQSGWIIMDNHLEGLEVATGYTVQRQERGETVYNERCV